MFNKKKQEINPDLVIKLRSLMDKLTSRIMIEGENKEEWVGVNLDEMTGQVVITLGHKEQEKEQIMLSLKKTKVLIEELSNRIQQPNNLLGGA